jgi:hypothetical protein
LNEHSISNREKPFQLNGTIQMPEMLCERVNVSPRSDRKEWVKPAVTRLQAGSAEEGASNSADFGDSMS